MEFKGSPGVVFVGVYAQGAQRVLAFDARNRSFGITIYGRMVKQQTLTEKKYGATLLYYSNFSIAMFLLKSMKIIFIDVSANN